MIILFNLPLMRKILALAGMELFFSVRKTSFIIYYVVLFATAALLVHVMAGFFPGVNFGGDTFKVNGTAMVDTIVTFISLITTFIVASFAGSGAMRDYRYNSHEITFTYPISKPQYLLGKFFGIYLANLLLFTALLLGYALTCMAPWLNRDMFVPFSIFTYSNVFLQKLVINIFFLSAAFYVLGLLFRNVVVNWVGIIVFYVLYFMAGRYYSQTGTREMAALMDPYGLYGRISVNVGTTTEQRNTGRIAMEGLYLWNRLIWLGIGVLFLLIGLWRFRFSYQNVLPRLRRKTLPVVKNVAATTSIPQPAAAPRSFGSAFFQSTFFSQLKLECRQLFRNPYFYLINCAGIVFLILSSFTVGELLDTPGYPTTIRVLETFTDAMSIFMLLILMVFSGEAVWRDQQHRLSGITGSTPASQATRLAAKTLAIYLPILVLLCIVLIVGVMVQVSGKYDHINIPLYFKYLFGYAAPQYLYYAILAIALQTLVRGKYQGYFLFAAVYMLLDFFGYRILHQGFLVPGYFPPVTYSDITGFQGAFYPFAVFAFYWLVLAVILWRAGAQLWIRNSNEPAPFRISSFLQGLKPKSTLTWILAGIFVATGVFIWYNTNVQNEHHSEHYYNKVKAGYETKYKYLNTAPKLSISDVQGNLDLMPDERSMKATITLTLVNKNTQPVSTFYMNLGDPEWFRDWNCSADWTQVLKDDKATFYGYKFGRPVAPGDSITLSYRFVYEPKGFTDDGVNSFISKNGTFINNTVFLPVIGYDPANELDGNQQRKKYGLGPKPYDYAQTDPVAIQENMLGYGADRINQQLTISTEKGQTAIAPGYLMQQWEKDGRSYFRYEMDRPVVNYFSIQSGRYSVKNEAFTIRTDSLRQPVKLSIYYHPDHKYNVDLMMRAMKDALTYYSATFSPYQYRQLRIVEFPSNAFAQSFANTIPFSENIGFLADLRDTSTSSKEKSPVDYVYYVTAHEVAHQWWGHQILPANTEGANFLCEALAQYSAMMLMKHQYGEDRVRKFLAMESFRYLSARGSERKEERPLVNVLKEQQYIFYDKGACALYALQNYLGEEVVNNAIKNFVHDYAFRERPYVTANELVARLKAAAPDSLKYLVDDCLNKVVVYDNKIKDATYSLNDETLEYTIEATIRGKKSTYDLKGKEKEVPMNDWVTIGIYNKEDKLVATQKVKVPSGAHRITFASARRPDKVMINPDFDLQEKDYLRNSSKVKVEKK